MTVRKLISFSFSIVFLLILTAPSFMLLISKHDLPSVMTSIETETDNKDIENSREFSQVDFVNSLISEVCFYIAPLTLNFGFFTRNFKALPVVNTSPPPDLV